VQDSAAAGTRIVDRLGDARFDPLYGTQVLPGMDLVHATVQPDGQNLRVHIGVKSLADLNQAFTATGAGAIDYVARWIGPAVQDPTQGEEYPIFYAMVEIVPGGVFNAFAGMATSVDLCSVSACTPRIVDYGATGNGGTQVSVTLEHAADHDGFFIEVPRSLVGNPGAGSALESFSAFTFARPKSAAVRITNAEAEADVVPVMVDGVCCSEAIAR
jgi:hypothetical protein